MILRVDMTLSAADEVAKRYPSLYRYPKTGYP